MRGKLAVILMIFISGCCGMKVTRVEGDGCIYYYNWCGGLESALCVNERSALIESEENEQKK